MYYTIRKGDFGIDYQCVRTDLNRMQVQEKLPKGYTVLGTTTRITKDFEEKYVKELDDFLSEIKSAEVY